MNDALIDRFCDHLWLEDGLAQLTLAAYRRDLLAFGHWLQQSRSSELNAAVAGDIEAYLAWRFAQHTQPRSAARYTSSLKRFYRYLLRENLIATDPTLNLDSPKLPRSLPKTLTEADVERLLNSADAQTRAEPARPRDAGDAVRHRLAGVRTGGAEADGGQSQRRRAARHRQGQQGSPGAAGRGSGGVAATLSERTRARP